MIGIGGSMGWRVAIAGFAGAVVTMACGGDPGGVIVPPPPDMLLDLDPGESVTLRAPANVRRFEIGAAADAREYRLILHSAATSPGSNALQLRVAAAGAPVASARQLPLVTSPGRAGGRATRMPSLAERVALGEARFKRGVRQSLEALGTIRPLTMPRGSLVRRSTLRQPPVEGDIVELNVLTSVTGGCTSTTPVDGEVRYVGQRVALVEDAQIAGIIPDARWRTLGQALDADPFAIGFAYFGQPGDLDGNDRVIAFVTAEVNKLTPRNSQSLIAGFFWSGDLLPAAGCPGSNEGEVLYLIAPDPDGEFSDPVPIEEAEGLIASTGAHELEHLISAQRRVEIAGSSVALGQILEDAWLDEGLAHLAEELSGLATADLALRQNLGLDPWRASPTTVDAFNDFQIRNVSRLGEYLQAPATSRALGEAGGGDPGGVASLRMRGFAWGFVRWLGDQFGPSGGGIVPGSGEAALFRELTTGGPELLRGADNVERAVSTVGGVALRWDELIALYLTSLVADDAVPGLEDVRETWKTHDLRTLFGDLNEIPNIGDEPPFDRPYPLSPTAISLDGTVNSTTTTEVRSATGAYFALASTGSTPDIVLEVTTPTGADLPSGASIQVTVLRVR